MRINRSLQRRVFATFGAFTLLLCLLYSAICALVAYVIEDQVLDNLLADEVRYIELEFRASGELPAPRLPYIELYHDGKPAPQDLLAAIPDGKTSAEWFADGERHFHLRRLDLDANTSAVLAAEVSRLLTVSRQSGNLLWLLISALLATAVLALWTAFRLSSRTVRPVLLLAEEVENRQTHSAALSLTASSARDEIGFLARTLESALNQLGSALQRETEFTRDVSHELRTAITIAKNTLALSRGRALSAQETEQLYSALSEMENTITSLLALARAESTEQVSFGLRHLLEERLLARHHCIAEAQFRIDLQLPDSIHALGNRHLSALLVDNLLDNALRHASRTELRIYQDGDALVFENPVAEAPDTEAAFLPRHKGARSDGMGQGLFLAKRILNALDWDFSAHCSNGRFSCTIHPKLFT
ncbi:Signal transduction histidine kinase [Microbulbifer donghaiensis]|uniref:histidine kinase n=1 Tax=Microbulbifer donghaiensis TaxID=494016 RepID=A0A1M5DU38_9GAMM|nr:HAMP domain-containing sensor histidine kinase [Microbulbifer donghaiensis]SHF70322.1 Signal transduction histidine kinase [Microbulbifer donghaiensis]